MLTHPLHSFAYAYFLSKRNITTKMHDVTVDFILYKSKKKQTARIQKKNPTRNNVGNCIGLRFFITNLFPSSLNLSNIVLLFSSVN